MQKIEGAESLRQRLQACETDRAVERVEDERKTTQQSEKNCSVEATRAERAEAREPKPKERTKQDEILIMISYDSM